MEDQKIDIHDHLQQHCRMLGHKVPFEYCRRMNSSLPCSKILDCWKNIFPVNEFIKQNYSEDEIALIFKPVQPKLVQIFELMKKAKENVKSKQQKDS
jgi:hypothetical protein